MSFLPAWIIGFFFIAVIGITEARSNRGRRIMEYETKICQPFKRHLVAHGCGDCICRSHGYGSTCDVTQCTRPIWRTPENRECTPYREFTTQCHYCKCSASGNPIGCVEKKRGCLNDILEDLDQDNDLEGLTNDYDDDLTRADEDPVPNVYYRNLRRNNDYRRQNNRQNRRNGGGYSHTDIDLTPMFFRKHS